MPVVNLNSRGLAELNTSDSRYESKFFAKDSSGNIIERTEILQDTEYMGVTQTTISVDLFVDLNIIKNSNLSYSTTHAFLAGTLSVYLNGQNITKDIIPVGSGFNLDSDFENTITERSLLTASYVKI